MNSLSPEQQIIFGMMELGIASSELTSISSIFEVSGRIDIALFILCLNKLPIKHRVLINPLTAESNDSRKLYGNFTNFKVAVLDPSGDPGAETKSPPTITEILKSLMDEEFDLKSYSLIRGFIIQISPEKHICGIVTHHLVSDFLSHGLLWKDLAEIYRSAGVVPEDWLSAKADYSNFAERRLAWDSSWETDPSSGYWMGQLQNFKHAAVGHDSPQQRGGESSSSNIITLRGAEKDALEQFSRECRVTPFQTALAMVCLAESFVMRSKSVSLLVVKDQRFNGGHLNVVGHFAMAHPLNFEIDGSLTVIEFIKSVSKTCLELFNFCWVPSTVMTKCTELNGSAICLDYMDLSGGFSPSLGDLSLELFDLTQIDRGDGDFMTKNEYSNILHAFRDDKGFVFRAPSLTGYWPERMEILKDIFYEVSCSPSMSIDQLMSEIV